MDAEVKTVGDTWTGRNDTDLAMPSGVYLSMLETERRVVHGRVTLANDCFADQPGSEPAGIVAGGLVLFLLDNGEEWGVRGRIERKGWEMIWRADAIVPSELKRPAIAVAESVCREGDQAVGASRLRVASSA